MGQTSLKYLNRVGYNLYWDKIWESKNNYNNTFIKFCFVDFFFNNFFNNNFFKKYNVVQPNYLKSCKGVSYNFSNQLLFVSKPFWFTNKINFYTSNLWVLSYQNWIIFNVYIYTPESFRSRNKLLFIYKSKVKNYNDLYYDFI